MHYLLFILLLIASSVYAKDLGEFGATYTIKERDALEEIEERAKSVDWGKVFAKDKMEKLLRSYKPKELLQIPKAKKDRVFTVDLTYTLTFDIPDGKGGILYPKGYTFNPLDYVFLPNTLVVINGADEEQISWFKGSNYYKDPQVMLLITDGSYYEVSQKLSRPVFYANKEIAERLKISFLPSVLKQKGKVMEVKEYAIKTQNSRVKK